MATYFVVYLWQGERHLHSRWFSTWSAADRLAAEMRADGWRAWVEQH